MHVQLILRTGTKRWKAQMKRPEATVGRALGCTIRIPSSAVSRLHCRLRLEAGVLTVEDLESINGTFVNDERISTVTVVRPGDKLTVGPVTFEVEYDLPTAKHPKAREADEENEEGMPTVDHVPVPQEIELPDLPAANQLRDILRDGEDSNERPRKKRRKKRRNAPPDE